jgi:hypothetical protein
MCGFEFLNPLPSLCMRVCPSLGKDLSTLKSPIRRWLVKLGLSNGFQHFSILPVYCSSLGVAFLLTKISGLFGRTAHLMMLTACGCIDVAVHELAFSFDGGTTPQQAPHRNQPPVFSSISFHDLLQQ